MEPHQRLVLLENHIHGACTLGDLESVAPESANIAVEPEMEIAAVGGVGGGKVSDVVMAITTKVLCPSV